MAYFDILTSEHLTELKQYRFHKKKRLKKKFKKKYVKPCPSDKVYIWGKYLCCHPVTRKKITEQMILDGEVEVREWKGFVMDIPLTYGE